MNESSSSKETDQEMTWEEWIEYLFFPLNPETEEVPG